MKSKLRNLLLMVGLLSIPAAVNYLIFEKAKSFKPRTLKYFPWTYGNIRYSVSGQGAPLLLVHGMEPGAGMFEWEDSLEALSKRYRVYTIDLPGFGFTGKPDAPYLAFTYATLINDFIDEVIGKKGVRIAASGLSAACAITAYSFCPENFSSMVLISPTGVGTVGRPATARELYFKWLLESPILGTTIFNILNSRYFLRRYLTETAYGNSKNVTSRVLNLRYNSAHYDGVGSKYPFAAVMSGFVNVNVEHIIPKIKIPATIIWGEENKVNPISNFNIIERLNPEVRLHIVPGAKTLPHAEFPKVFHKICVGVFR